ncbi:membrane-associated protein, putative [Bodo saltans]|uniref:Membrane-associated protein, putative n=1 Tax=Bodo saltans TaxID=75058 RepID=A0A0S4JXJ5_BODSA|nr:membrane-associated protein, putative [Bodo saltans]|eukprot:CUG93309.1 membrane-associated protein, putative [Bodo saltans]
MIPANSVQCAVLPLLVIMFLTIRGNALNCTYLYPSNGTNISWKCTSECGIINGKGLLTGVQSCAPWPQGCLCDCICYTSNSVYACYSDSACATRAVLNVQSRNCQPIILGVVQSPSWICDVSTCNYRATAVSCGLASNNCGYTCLPQWYGPTCTVSGVCNITTDCNPQGTDYAEGYRVKGCTCSCRPGWYGDRCHCQIQQCSPFPATKEPHITTSPDCYCVCSLGFSGPTCSRNNSISVDTHSVTHSAELTTSASLTSKTRMLPQTDSITESKATSISVSSSIADSVTSSYSSMISLSSSANVSRTCNTFSNLPTLSKTPSKSTSLSKRSGTVNITLTVSGTKNSISDVGTDSRTLSSSIAASVSRMTSGTRSTSNDVSLSSTSAITATRIKTPSSTRIVTRSSSVIISMSSSLTWSTSSSTSNTKTVSKTLSGTTSISLTSTPSFSDDHSITDTDTATGTKTLPGTETLSCPTIARLSVSTAASDIWPTRNTTGNQSTRCYFHDKAEAAFSNSTSTLLPCVPLFANEDSGLVVFPPTRGPNPPYILAIPYAIDANWVVRNLFSSIASENGTALLLRDEVVFGGGGSHFDNKTNFTTASGTLLVLIASTPEWQSKITVPLETACGRQVVTLGASGGLEVSVVWPQKQFGTLDQVAVGLVTAGSTLSGNPTAAAALAMVGLLSCSGSTPALQSAGYFVSLFFSLGPAAVAAGNLAIILVVTSLHYVTVRAWKSYHTIATVADAMSDMRFPALSIFIAMYLLPGAVYGSVASVSSGDNIGAGVVGLAVVIALVVGSQVFLIKVVLPVSDFRPYPIPHKTAYFFERFALLPSSRWIPESAERRFMPLMGTRTKDWCTLSIVDLLLALCLSAATGLGVGTHGASCSVMPIVVASVYFLNAAIVVVLRPHRRPMDRITFPIIWVLFGVMCILKYLTASEDLIDTLQRVLSFVQLWQTVCALLIFFRERQWRQQILDDKSIPVDELFPAQHAAMSTTATHNDAQMLSLTQLKPRDAATLFGDDDDHIGAMLAGGREVVELDLFRNGVQEISEDEDMFGGFEASSDQDICLGDSFGFVNHLTLYPDAIPISSRGPVHDVVGVRMLQETETAVVAVQRRRGSSYIGGVASDEGLPYVSLLITAPVFGMRQKKK